MGLRRISTTSGANVYLISSLVWFCDLFFGLKLFSLVLQRNKEGPDNYHCRPLASAIREEPTRTWQADVLHQTVLIQTGRFSESL